MEDQCPYESWFCYCLLFLCMVSCSFPFLPDLLFYHSFLHSCRSLFSPVNWMNFNWLLLQVIRHNWNFVYFLIKMWSIFHFWLGAVIMADLTSQLCCPQGMLCDSKPLRAQIQGRTGSECLEPVRNKLVGIGFCKKLYEGLLNTTMLLKLRQYSL